VSESFVAVDTDGVMNVVVNAPSTDLATAVTRLIERGRSTRSGPRVLINVALQPPNTLLHDGHRWKRYQPRRLLAETRAALRAAGGADFVVHASYLFLGAPQSDSVLGPPLRVVADAACEAEDMMLRGRVPSCVVRLGYHYGPESRDLRLYRRAFHLGRPYWAGPPSVLQRHLHTDDAAAALLAAARQRPSGRTLTAADDMPVSFATFMDHFARLAGNPLPLHIPGLLRPLTRVLIAEEHVQMVDLASGDADDRPRPRGFAPKYADYRSGLQQVVDAWAD